MIDSMFYVVVVVGVTAFIQAITGFGFALLAVPILALRVSVHEAVVLSACMGTLNSGWQSVNLGRFANSVLVRRYIVASLVGIPIGYSAFVFLSEQLLRILVGVAVLAGTLIVATMGNRQVGVRTQRALGVVSGALLIATSTNGPPIVLALQAQGMPKQEFRGTLARICFRTHKCDSVRGRRTPRCVDCAFRAGVVASTSAGRVGRKPDGLASS